MTVIKKTKNKKKRTFFSIFKKIVFWLIFFSFWGLVVWTLLFSDMMKIKEIKIRGSSKDGNEIKNLVERESNQKYFDIIYKNNLILFPVDMVEDEIYREFKMIRNVKVTRTFPDVIEVFLEERKRSLFWCLEARCFFVDERAEAFHSIEKKEITKENTSIIVSDGSNRELKLKDNVISPKIIKLVFNLEREFARKLNLNLDRRTFYIPSPMSEELQVKTQDGWKIYFSTERPLALQLKILKKLLGSEVSESDLEKLEYIDMRVKGKVVYRFKDYKEREKELKESEEAEIEKEKASAKKKKKE